MFKKLITSVALVGVAVSVSAGVLSPITAFAAAEGAVTLNQTGGTSTTNFNISLPSGASCSGNGAANYRWETFIASSSIDVGTLIFSDGPNQPAGTFTSSLTDTAGNLVKQNFPGAGGLISAIPQLNFSSLIGSGITAGNYKVGIFCANLNSGGAIGRLDGIHYWETTIVVSNPATLAWSLFVVPGPPTLSTVTGGVSSTLSGTFTAPASTPATQSYTVTASPQPSGTPTTLVVTAPATGFTLPGLLNGTTYSVRVQTTNAVGTSVVSNAISTLVFDINLRPPVTALAGSPVINGATLTWVAPTGVAPTGYSIAVTGPTTVVGSPFTAAAGALTFTVPVGACGASYLFTVTPTHGTPFVGTPVSIGVVPNCAGSVIQDITVVRPAGALVLTQRCGVNGAIPAEITASPGFPVLPGIPASANSVGTDPTLLANGAGGADPQSGNYPNPNPVAIETHCGVNLSSGQLVTSGPLSGQYYRSSGFINQLTVSDTRDTDTGWAVNGTMSNFSVVGASFSGNYLGWSPVVSSTSLATSGGYDQVATAGATIPPDTAAGLATPKVLSSAAGGAGLGIATFDARLKLLIPVSARAGTYTGTLTFTVA